MSNSNSSKNEAIIGEDSIEAQLEQLREDYEELQEEMRACKEFFGYDPEMSVEEMQSFKDEVEGEDKIHREEDPEFDEQCSKSDTLVDTVLKLGEYQYTVAEIYGSLKKFSPETSEQRKKFTLSFDALFKTIPEDDSEEFFDLLRQWLEAQEQIFILDNQVKNLS